MEKKNTILLTVIAIATLLVAVVGATFAYFTATLQTDTSQGGKTTEVTSKTIVTAKMKLGADVSPTETVYPGYKVVKTVDISGSGDANSAEVKAQIVLKPSVPSQFGTDIKYYVYKTKTSEKDTAGVTCGKPEEKTGTVSETDATITHFMETICTNNTDDILVANGSGNLSGTTPVNISIDPVKYNTADTYYILIEYYNSDSVQNPTVGEDGIDNSQAGKTFSVEIDFKEVA